MRVREQRERLKSEQLKKLIQTLINPPLQEYNGPIEYRSGSRAENFLNNSRNSNVDRMSPVHNKKGRLSKLFGVFSNKLPNEQAPGTSNSPPSPDHTTANVSVNLDKETMRRKSSVVISFLFCFSFFNNVKIDLLLEKRTSARPTASSTTTQFDSQIFCFVFSNESNFQRSIAIRIVKKITRQ